MTTGFGTTPLQSRVGELVAGRLRIVRELGRGGMGAVYEVEHELTRHRRALKLLHPHMSALPQVVERFLREASAAGRIGNPHIVETFDAGRLDSGEPYIVMELLEGVCLSDYLVKHAPLSPDLACDLLAQACDAIHAAHEVGIIHRDLKPENLHLSFSQGLPFVKVLDFGISKFDAELTGIKGVTVEGTPIGTPYYMCPEQFQGGPVDRRSDVYALGIVLYECLAGRRPFEPDNLTHLIAMVLHGDYTPPSELQVGIPKALDGVVAKAMAVERDERYGTARELRQALEAAFGRSASQPPPVIDAAVPNTTLTPKDRVVAALTPDVFSGAPHDLSPHQGRHALRPVIWSLVGLTLFLGGTLALLRRQPLPTGQQPSSPVETTGPATSAEATASAELVSGIVVGTAIGDRVTLAGSAPTALSTATVGSTAASDSAALSAPPSVKPTMRAARAKERPAPAPTASAKKRASAYGLNETNPFD